MAQEGTGSNSASQMNTHRRFENVHSYVKELGGDKSHVIEKVLIANNGVAAVKCIRSVRRWAYDVFGDERAIQFVVMATPEDLRANAEYIRMADVIVDVPGGSNNHNYANVTLIVELARLHGVNAVWAGWGHASENPILPDTLASSNPPIKFIGPAGPPMRALGDKIGSTIIAQTAGVPCIAWNGDGVFANYDRSTGSLPEESYNKGSIASVEEACEASKRIGFPIMIKASEGGGGKGIRMVSQAEDVPTAYRQVCGEVPGSPIFIMKLSSKSRHLEVQLLADEYGNAVALNGRDCSVQRRHQKIIEEGPPVAAPADVWDQMEKAAVSLAKAVGYANAGTVEYLYSEPDKKFYFLELNPRLQVEHPVTEMITKANLPAAQLQVAMGIKLYNIPDIRTLYGRNRFEESYDESAVINFDTVKRSPAVGHCIAVRITAENAEAGFKPTSGGIQELNFRSTPNVWGYFSMDSSGSIHEYADSQFGHLFASGNDREEARRNMVLALKELSIRGDISTTVDYISQLIEFDDFVANNIDTGWLDKLIKQNGEALGAQNTMKKSISSAKLSPLANDVKAVIGSLIVAFDSCASDEDQFEKSLIKGQLPPQSLLAMEREVELILDGIKYKLCCARNGPNLFSVSVSGAPEKFVVANVRRLSDGGYLTAIGGKSRVAYLTSRGDAASGMRITIGGATVSFSPDYDPTSLRTDVAGKLVKKLVEDGAHVNKGDAYCEIEVMKMFMPLKVTETGTLSWKNNEGAALAPGDLIANLELDNPENVATTTTFEGDMDIEGWGANSSNETINRPHLVLRSAFEALSSSMSGYILNADGLNRAFKDLFQAVNDPLLPVYEIDEHLSVLSGRLDASLNKSLKSDLTKFKAICENGEPTEAFPAEEFSAKVLKFGESIQDPNEKTAFNALVTPLVDAARPYTHSNSTGVVGSERALQGFLTILRNWIDVERWFSDGKSFADAIDCLRKANVENYDHVLNVCRAHAGLKSSSVLVARIIDAIADALHLESESSSSKPTSVVAGAYSLRDAAPCLSEIGSMGSSQYTNVSLTARKVLLQESLPSIEERKSRISIAVKDLSESLQAKDSSIPKSVTGLVEDGIPFADVFYPLVSTFPEKNEKMALAELYVRKLYNSQKLGAFSRDIQDLRIEFAFNAKDTERIFSASTPVTSMTDLTKAISRSGSLQQLADFDGNAAVGQLPPNTSRTAVCKLAGTLQEIGTPNYLEKSFASFPQYTGASAKSRFGPTNVLYVIVTEEKISNKQESMDSLSQKLQNLLQPLQQKLEQSDIRRVSFIFSSDSAGENVLPSILTFRAQYGFKEDNLFRNIEPGHAYLLDLTRLSTNFTIKLLDSRQAHSGHVHLYKATPRVSSLAMDKKANPKSRIYARSLSFISDFTSTSFEKMLVDAMNALDIAVHEHGHSVENHLFLNMVSDHEQLILDPVSVENTVVSILKRHSDRISALGVSEVETKLVCTLTSDSPPIALRMVASNPTGYVHVMNTYVEAESPSSATPIFKLIGGTKASLASSGDSSWEGSKITSPYPLTKPFEVQRKAALRASDSLYCYDIPALFEAAVEKQWSDAAEKGGIEGDIRAASRPLMVMYTSELVVERKNKESVNWTMEDYLNGDLAMVQTQRRAGANDVGMVAWLMTLKTVEYPEGRQVVLIANDITHKAGSFGTREDVVFKLASEYARKNRLPRLYVAANSGARIGLSESVKKLFKVAFKDESKPENGFEFLYVTASDYEKHFKRDNTILVEEAVLNGEKIFKITDIIGEETDLGVENLKGSGLIAGETSAAYNDIFTMTLVLGRTVGIGAYLVRLGQRTIQKVNASPIILTGYQALNKLMGVDVYSTNDQLGGPGIMYSNGVSHLTASDHLDAIESAMQWLSYIPSIRGGFLPISDVNGIDEIERTVDFKPTAGVPYDPRFLMTGTEHDDGTWMSGFFDKGSFVETLSGWAKSVVVGRARLGGIPMGVIATENRTAEAIKPADPADLQASEAIKQEAGCVWFPNSAYKTAQAINDFRTEDLPLMIFANWRGFSGGQRDMFDEVLKYGSLIVDGFVAYEQPIFVFIPPHAEIRGGAWVVLDASINPSVMEMYAASGSARGGVLEANGAAAVKYREKDLLKSMRRIDEKLVALYKNLETSSSDEKEQIKKNIADREKSLLPVYAQVAVQFCELHDTPGRMKAVGVIEKDVNWAESRTYFYWRLRRKLAEFDLRKKIMEAGDVGRGVKSVNASDSSTMIKQWFLDNGNTDGDWNDDKKVLMWMGQNNEQLEAKVAELAKHYVSEEVFLAMSAGGNTSVIGTQGIVEGISRAMSMMSLDQKEALKQNLKKSLDL